MMNTNNLNICWEWWGRTSRDLHWDDFVFCKDWNCLFPGLSLQQKMSCVKGTLLPNHFSTNVFRVLLRAIRVTTDKREGQEKKTGTQYPGCYLSKTFDPLCSSWMFNLQVCLHQRNSSPTKILISKLDWKSSQHQMTKNMLDIRYEKWVAPIYDFLFYLDTFLASNHAKKLHCKIKTIIIIVTILIVKMPCTHCHSLGIQLMSIGNCTEISASVDWTIWHLKAAFKHCLC